MSPRFDCTHTISRRGNRPMACSRRRGRVGSRTVHRPGVLPTTETARRHLISGVEGALSTLGMGLDEAVDLTAEEIGAVLSARQLAINELGHELAERIAPRLSARISPPGSVSSPATSTRGGPRWRVNSRRSTSTAAGRGSSPTIWTLCGRHRKRTECGCCHRAIPTPNYGTGTPSSTGNITGTWTAARYAMLPCWLKSDIGDRVADTAAMVRQWQAHPQSACWIARPWSGCPSSRLRVLFWTDPSP